MFFVSDLDGTLLNEQGVLPARAAAVIALVQSRGHFFSLATSRSFLRVRAFADELALKTPIITNQGAFIRDPKTGEILDSWVLEPQDVCALLRVGQNFGITPFVFGHDDNNEFVGIPSEITKAQEIYTKARPQDPRFVAMPDPFAMAESSVFCLDFHLPCPQTEAVVRALLGVDAAFQFSVIREAPDIDLIEITHKNASKGKALTWLSGFSGIPLSDFVVFGDNGNDESLFDAAGAAYAVANAVPALKKKATAMIPSNAEGGVLSFLEKQGVA